MDDPGIDAVYVSPHLDDAALSCGGQIADRVARGERVAIATVFTADIPADAPLSAFAAATLDRWDLAPADAMARRRAEDVAACAALGAEPVHLDLLDAMLRVLPPDAFGSSPPAYEGWPAMLRARALREPALVAGVSAALATLPPARFVAAPLAAGHVDHRLVRAAAERVWPGRLALYADLPYARGRRGRWRALGWRPWRRGETVAVPEPARRARRRALACYASQGGETLAEAAERAERAWGGERWWPARPGGPYG